MASDTLRPLASLTLRAILAGNVFGLLVAVINAYFGFKTGWGLSGGLISAIFGYGFFNQLRLRHPYTRHENVITQTTGSSASIMIPTIGVISILPALKMMGHALPYTGMLAWGFSVSLLGIFFAVPLRHQMIVVEQLRFPSGIVSAHTIQALHSDDPSEAKKTKYLLYIALITGIYIGIAHFFPVMIQPHLMASLGFTVWASLGFTLNLSPLLMGAGIVIGPRTCCSLILGAIIGWGILGPLAQQHHWVHGAVFNYKHGVAGWLLWPGVGLLVSESITSLALQIVSIVKRPHQHNDAVQSADLPIPKWWWLGGLALGSALCMVVMHRHFHIPPHFTAIAIAAASILSAVASRALGETEINPVTAAGKMSQLLFAGLVPGQVFTNMMAGGIATAAAASAGDMMHDWKTGHLLGTPMRAQFIAQIIGVFVGVLFAVPIYIFFDHAYVIGGTDMPAPTAHAWQATAELLAGGWNALPSHADVALRYAFYIGALLPLLRLLPQLKKWLPSGLAVAIGMIVPPFYSIAMFIGAMILAIWQRRAPQASERWAFTLAAGLIIGEGLMNPAMALVEMLL